LASDFLKKAKGLFGREAEPKPVPAKKPANLYHAVSIMPGPRCCAAARDLVGQRFLSRQAPPLPLKGCDRASCECHYEHHPDRRKTPRRARDLGVSVDGYDGNDQRTGTRRGRRKSDG
jgi:hypothetical protein